MYEKTKKQNSIQINARFGLKENFLGNNFSNSVALFSSFKLTV